MTDLSPLLALVILLLVWVSLVLAEWRLRAESRDGRDTQKDAATH